MPAPIFEAWNSDNTQIVASHDFGQVKASKASNALVVNLWNNKKDAADGSVRNTDVSDVIEATVTTRDASGGVTGDTVLNQYVEVNVNGELNTPGDSASGLKWRPLGYDESTTSDVKAAIRAKAIAASTDSNGGGKFSGTANDGNPATAATQENFAQLQFHVNLPANAAAGTQSGLIRFEGYYV